jgi:hypothetical protein
MEGNLTPGMYANPRQQLPPVQDLGVPQFQPMPAEMYASGGKIVGPGTGTSDSIPAVVSGVRPIRVSNGEYIIPKHVVDHFGVDAFDQLLDAVKG